MRHMSRGQMSDVSNQTLGDLLRGATEQSIYQQSVTQRYTLGSIMEMPAPDNRKYRYFQAREGLTKYLAAYNHNQWPINGNSAADAAAGQRRISVPEATCVANAYKGGYLVVFTTPLQFFMIVANTESDGTNTILTLDHDIPALIPAGTFCTGYPSMYSNVQSPPAPDPDYISFVCVPNINVTVDYYFWGQVKGVCYGVADSTVPGSEAAHRDVYFASSGNLLAAGTPPGYAGFGTQRAGYLLPRTESGSGDQLYFLQLE